MRWFKHDSTGHKSAKFITIRDRLGLVGIAQYYIIVEMCVEQITTEYIEKNGFVFSFNLKHFKNVLGMNSRSIGYVLQTFHELKLFSSETQGNVLQIVFPNILNLLGSDSALFRANSGGYPKKSCLEEERELEPELEGEGERHRPRVGKKRNALKSSNIVVDESLITSVLAPAPPSSSPDERLGPTARSSSQEFASAHSGGGVQGVEGFGTAPVRPINSVQNFENRFSDEYQKLDSLLSKSGLHGLRTSMVINELLRFYGKTSSFSDEIDSIVSGRNFDKIKTERDQRAYIEIAIKKQIGIMA
jgi:hypothetical protein